MWKAAYLFLTVYLLAFIFLFLKFNTATEYYSLIFIPCLISIAWFAANKCKLSGGLNSVMILLVFIDWLSSYGRIGLLLPVFLTMLIIDLRLSDFVPKKDIVFRLFFLITCLYLVRISPYSLTEAFNSFACALLPTALFIFYAYASRGMIPLNKFLANFCFVLGLLSFIFFSLVRKYEYLYLFEGENGFSKHPEFFVSQYLIGILLLLVFAYHRKIVHLILILLVGFFYLPSYEVSSKWQGISLSGYFSQTGFHEILFGGNFRWKLLPTLLTEYNVSQFPLSLYSIWILEGGLLLLGLWLSFFFLLVFRNFKRDWRISFVAGLIFISALYFPVLRDPISLVLIAAIFSGTSLAESKSGNSDRYAVYGFISLSAIFISYAALQASIALSSKPLIDQLDRNFQASDSFYNLLLTSEDLMFFRHKGIDYFRLKEVILQTLKNRSYDKGGSTISMQLAKVGYIGSEVTVSRKFRQFIFATYLEMTKSKGEIIHEYLSMINFGPGEKGLISASNLYYKKLPRDLNYDESLRLVMSIPDPAAFNPNSPMDKSHSAVMEAVKRRELQFRRMLNTDRRTYVPPFN